MSQPAHSLIGDLNPKFYKDHSEIQYKIAQTPLQNYPFFGGESILDIGCGDGKITAQLAQFVPQGQVIGIDKSQAMIAFAQKAFPKQEYPHVCFKQLNACSFKFNMSFDLITSFSCLHWIKEQKLVLQNIQQHLKPKAKTLILTFPRCQTFWDPIEAIVHKKKWKSFFESDPYPYCFLDEAKYKILCEEVNLNLLHIETTSHVAKFEGKQGFENYVRGWLPFLLYLPSHLHDELLDEIGTQSLEFAPLQKDGFVYHPYEKILIYAQRKL